MSIRYYRVKRGETLSSISKMFYGSEEYAMTIFQSNRHYITNPNEIYSGQRIAIPFISPVVEAIKVMLDDD